MIEFEGELDMGNPRHVFKPEGNSWIQQLEDQIVLGPSHVFVYIKTDGYKRFVAEDILFLKSLILYRTSSHNEWSLLLSLHLVCTSVMLLLVMLHHQRGRRKRH